MSNPARRFGGHGTHFDVMSPSADPRMANAPKGTLTLRHMTSREGGYNPEAVVVPGYGYEPHGEDFLYNNTLRAYASKKHGAIVQQYYTTENRKLILRAVLDSLREKTGTQLTSANVPGDMVDMAMRKAFEVYGESVENSPHATVGPSESLPWLAPPEKYGDFAMNIDQCNDESLARLNLLAARLLRENIISEKALLSRYHADLGGAIHVLEYPSRPGPELRRGHQLNFRYYEDITSAPDSGISGNRLTSGGQSNADQSVKFMDNAPSYRPAAEDFYQRLK